jgi:hypothetical protein
LKEAALKAHGTGFQLEPGLITLCRNKKGQLAALNLLDESSVLFWGNTQNPLPGVQFAIALSGKEAPDSMSIEIA